MKTIWIILITIIVTGVIAGGVAYYAGRNQWDKEKIELDKKVQDLENETRFLNQQISDLKNVESNRVQQPEILPDMD